MENIINELASRLTGQSVGVESRSEDERNREKLREDEKSRKRERRERVSGKEWMMRDGLGER